MSKTGLKFSHKVTTFVFIGEPLPLPSPGTYDASAWTPPTHRVYKAEFQDDGLWALYVNNAIVDKGNEEKASKKRAIELIEAYRKNRAKH